MRRTAIHRRQFLQNVGIATSTLLVSGCSTLHQRAGTGLRSGVAKRTVTPPLWVPYLTSSGNGTHAAFTGKHDDLFARALVISDGVSSVAMLTVDSIGYDNDLLAGGDFTNELRRRVSASTGLRPESIMLASTHAHSTPETICLSDIRDVERIEQWIEEHLRTLAGAVVDAWKNQVPVRMSSGKSIVEGVSRNRRIMLKDGKQNRYGPIPSHDKVAIPFALDDELSVVYLETHDGCPHSVLLNFTAHPVIAMLLPEISADYPGVACRDVENAFPGAVCLFTQGAAGNINTAAVSSNFADVERIGGIIGNSAIDRIKQLRRSRSFAANPTISTVVDTIELNPRECPSVEEARAQVRANRTPQTQRVLRLAQKLARRPLRAEVQGMRIGDISWVSMPGEAFVETGLSLKKAGASFVVGYANDWLGYFPTQHSYAEGGYEVELGAWSRVAPGSAEKLEDFGLKLFKKLDASNGVG